MIALLSERDIAEVLGRIREYRGITARQLADQLYIDRRTVRGRDTGQNGYTVAALLDTARILGYRVALIPIDQDQGAAA